MAYSLGLDFGSNSVRCVVVDTANGNEIGECVWVYETGEMGIVLDSSDHNVARQNPADYLKGTEITILGALAEAKKNPGFDASDVIGIGFDCTGSTPLPVNEKNEALSMTPEFAGNVNAYAWLWKDHTGYKEAAAITKTAAAKYPEYLAKCGGTYSSEWLYSKIWHCLNVDKAVYDASHSWVEICDWIPAMLAGIDNPADMKRSRCAAGHKAMYCEEWGGLPAQDFFEALSPELTGLKAKLFDKSYTNDEKAGALCAEWAAKLGLKEGVTIGVGAFDCHYGAIGCGIEPGVMVKTIGTSTCDVIVWPADKPLADIPGICGIVDGSVLPGCYGIEAGQSAVGDILNWFVNYIQPEGREEGTHRKLTEKCANMKPGQNGLLALDWNNGNRTILVDQRLTGLLLGQTLHTKPEEIYRALIEGTAFGALKIINRIEEYGVKINEVVCCGGIAEKNDVFMQIYADVFNREMKVSRSAQSCALGAAIGAAVAAGEFPDFDSAQKQMTGVKEKSYRPIPENVKVYEKLFALYSQLHDGFGIEGSSNLANVMKDLLDIKEAANA
jgi:L-ribulokinase